VKEKHGHSKRFRFNLNHDKSTFDDIGSRGLGTKVESISPNYPLEGNLGHEATTKTAWKSHRCPVAFKGGGETPPPSGRDLIQP